MKKKLLLTSRDYSSGLNVFALSQSSLMLEYFDISVILGSPSNQLFRNMLPQDSSTKSLECLEHFECAAEYGKSISDAIRKMQILISDEAPDIIMTGISGTGIGVDEIATKVCKGTIPVVSFQDYWGYINEGLGCIADKVLLMDNFAKSATKKNYPNLVCEIVGSLKYDFYLNHVIDKLAKKMHENHCVPDDYWVFIGQPIFFIDDYISIIELVLKYAENLKIPCYYLPHPAVNLVDINKYLPPKCLLADSQKITKEILLLKSSKVFTCFSTYVTDLLIMKQLFSLTKPDITMITISEKIQDYRASFPGAIPDIPIPEDLVFNVRSAKEINLFLERGNNINSYMQFNSALTNVKEMLTRELEVFT